jgi:hypothetical protein
VFVIRHGFRPAGNDGPVSPVQKHAQNLSKREYQYDIKDGYQKSQSVFVQRVFQLGKKQIPASRVNLSIHYNTDDANSKV